MGNGVDVAAPRKTITNEETAPAKAPGKLTQVETSARRLTGVPVVDDAHCVKNVADVNCWLTPDERSDLRAQVYIMVKQAMDNGRDALMNVMLDIVVNKRTSTWWGGLAELFYRGITSYLIGKLLKSWTAFQAAPTWLGKAIVEPKTLKMIEGVSESVARDALASVSVSFRTVLKNAAYSDEGTELRDLAYLRSTFQPAFGAVVLQLTTGPLARKMNDAELAGLYHAYNSEDYSIASWETMIRDIYQRYRAQNIDKVGAQVAPKEVSRKDAMVSETTSGSFYEMVTFVRKTDGSSMHALVERELDERGRIKLVNPIDDDQSVAADIYQKERNFQPPRVLPAENTGDPKIDAWGRMTITPIEGAAS